MLSCFGIRKSHSRDGEREPLLPQYNDDTSRETRLHEKLHTYQMLRAVSKGYMPSNEQAIVHLRSLLSADVLNPDLLELSPSGRALIRSTKMWITQLIELLQHKSGQNQIQDFVWYLTKARLDIDFGEIGARAAASKAKADASATLASLRTVGSLLLTNSEFRVFLADLSTIAREIFRDTALTLADVSRRAGDQLQPSAEATDSLKHPSGSSEAGPTDEDLENQVQEVAQVVSSGAAEVVGEARHSIAEHVTGDEQKALLQRLKQAVLKLRKRPDYSESASTLSLLLRRYLAAYSKLTSDTVHAVEHEVGSSREADKSVDNFWQFMTSIGDREQWAQVEKSFKEVVEAGRSDPEFDKLTQELADLVQGMLTDPGFFDNAEERLQHVRTRVRRARINTASSITSLVRVKVAGLSLAADDVGYWIRLHSRLLRTTDEGLVNFHLDKRGMDIALDIEIGRDRVEEILSLRRGWPGSSSR
ncbi:hypothetical protein HIM_09941 [Hirsutella minnesotensis 3608]|uniref:HAM1-like N-terminal domain-containing protein n=1 Tax=Hirsutella minnesotensis 3608 TaxID=1043627 RepID=A0A0F7ZS34_9HYPO|nr:hypothetical protein HIM_09941 [Hirsutella minnesotensis 3608]